MEMEMEMSGLAYSYALTGLRRPAVSRRLYAIIWRFPIGSQL